MNTFEFRIGYKYALISFSVDTFSRNPEINPSPYIFLIIKNTAAMENRALSKVAYLTKFSESCFILLYAPHHLVLAPPVRQLEVVKSKQKNKVIKFKGSTYLVQIHLVLLFFYNFD